MSIRVYASSGGGVRIGATFGALLEGELQGAFNPRSFDWYLGTSAGSLDAALTANGWTAEQKKALFLRVDFGKLFTPLLMPFGVRLALAVAKPISLSKLEIFYKSLCGPNPYGPPLEFKPNLLINTVDANDNTQIVYCQRKPEWAPGNDKIRYETLPLWTAMTRSSVLPGLVGDDPRYMDGGVAENPLLSILPRDAEVLLLHLGYPGLVKKNGDTVPKGILDRALYAYEFKAYSAAELLMAEFPKLKAIFPQVFDVDSTAFNISREQKETMMIRAMQNTREQWKALKL